MRYAQVWWSLMLVMLLLLGSVSGCGDDSGGADDESGGASPVSDTVGDNADGDGAAGDGAPMDGASTDADDTITVDGQMLDFTSGGLFAGPPYPPIDGVEVCVLGTDNCVTNDADGRYSLEVAPGDEVSLVFSKEGYERAIQPAHLPVKYIDTILTGMLKDIVVESFVDIVGISLDDRTGQLELHAFKRGAEGTIPHSMADIQFTLSTGTGEGPLYVGSDATDVNPDGPTGSTGLAYIVNVETGIVEVTVSGGSNCEPWGSWDAADGNLLSGPVEANTRTLLSVVCD